MPDNRAKNAPARRGLQAIAALAFLIVAPAVMSSEYSDNLSECLLISTTEEDKNSLVRWMFTSIALYPALEEVADISLASREQANREMAELIVKLLARSCYSETRLALQNEENSALVASFSVFGQLAAASLFSAPNVAADLASIETYISAEDLESRLEIGQ